MVKSRNYWTYEKCKEEALKYQTKKEFRKNAKGCIKSAIRNGWMIDICSHMINLIKPNGYWTKEKCHEESLKYQTRNELWINNASVHVISNKNGWLDEICSHMIPTQKPTGYWTKEKCQEETLKYNTRSEFQKNNASVYKISRINGWLDEICNHMILLHKPNNYWTKKRCQEEALKYINRTEFSKNSSNIYSAAHRNGWLDEICNHMIILQKPNGYWTKELCKEEALKCKTRSEFQKNNSSTYNSALKNGWLDEICSHMIIQNNNTKRCIYCYEFSDNSVYVGLTYNLEKRQKDRDNCDNDQVTKHIKESKLKPIRKQLTEYINVNDAIKLEGYYVEKYNSEGWCVLNKAKTGAIGGPLRWTYEKCKKEALKYKSRHEFENSSKGAYESSRKNGWLDEVCSHIIPTQKPRNYWTKEKCHEESLKYNSKSELRIKNNALVCAAYRNGWLDEICSHMKNKRNN